MSITILSEALFSQGEAVTYSVIGALAVMVLVAAAVGR